MSFLGYSKLAKIMLPDTSKIDEVQEMLNNIEASALHLSQTWDDIINIERTLLENNDNEQNN